VATGPGQAKRERVNSSIQIMLMDLTLDPHTERERDLLPRLHATEQERYRCFSHPRRRQTWLAGRGLLLAALEKQLGHVEPSVLRTDAEGGVRYGDGIVHLSLSHCRELIAVALSDKRIGLDLEWPRPRKSVQHAGHVFSESEAGQLHALPDAEREAAFYMLWTLKEAACKAAGVSLWTSLHKARFGLDKGEFYPQPPFPDGHWWFMSACIEPGWRLATAVCDTEMAPRIECWRMTERGRWCKQPLARQLFLQGK
jgi:4'-phosphopantetheinyl transferase